MYITMDMSSRSITTVDKSKKLRQTHEGSGAQEARVKMVMTFCYFKGFYSHNLIVIKCHG